MIKLIPYIEVLLATSALAMYFIIKVVIKQISLFKLSIGDKDIRHFRRTLFAISMTIIFTGLIPIAINIYTLFNKTSRPAEISPVSFIYSMGVHIQALLLSWLLWRIYRLASGNFNDKD
jgi:hypothetical protein